MRTRQYFNFPLVNDFRSNPTLNINGSQIHPYDSVKGHTGIDIGCTMGTEISFPAELTFIHKEIQQEMGLCAYFKDSQENVLVFAHLSEINLEKGTIYPAGTKLFKTGNSGAISTNPHLHFEIIAKKSVPGLEMMTRSLMGHNGWNIDPVVYLDGLIANPALKDLDWFLKHFPEIDKAWLQAKADKDPQFLLLLRTMASRIIHDWIPKS